jgi:hypothetical protein
MSASSSVEYGNIRCFKPFGVYFQVAAEMLHPVMCMHLHAHRQVRTSRHVPGTPTIFIQQDDNSCVYAEHTKYAPGRIYTFLSGDIRMTLCKPMHACVFHRLPPYNMLLLPCIYLYGVVCRLARSALVSN